MSDAVRFGLVGYGAGGRIFHAPLLASAGNVEFLGREDFQVKVQGYITRAPR